MDAGYCRLDPHEAELALVQHHEPEPEDEIEMYMATYAELGLMAEAATKPVVKAIAEPIVESIVDVVLEPVVQPVKESMAEIAEDSKEEDPEEKEEPIEEEELIEEPLEINPRTFLLDTFWKTGRIILRRRSR
ncbi:hypothetical protein Droror1_Dr00002820 [Drosera rotundifolia]